MDCASTLASLDAAFILCTAIGRPFPAAAGGDSACCTFAFSSADNVAKIAFKSSTEASSTAAFALAPDEAPAPMWRVRPNNNSSRIVFGFNPLIMLTRGPSRLSYGEAGRRPVPAGFVRFSPNFYGPKLGGCCPAPRPLSAATQSAGNPSALHASRAAPASSARRAGRASVSYPRARAAGARRRTRPRRALYRAPKTRVWHGHATCRYRSSRRAPAPPTTTRALHGCMSLQLAWPGSSVQPGPGRTRCPPNPEPKGHQVRCWSIARQDESGRLADVWPGGSGPSAVRSCGVPLSSQDQIWPCIACPGAYSVRTCLQSS